MDEILRIEGLTAGYDGKPIIEDINLSIKEGEILGIVGESGSGKTTILKALLGVRGLDTQVYSGSIVYNGRNMMELTDANRRDLLGREISMIFQNSSTALNPNRKIWKQFQDVLLRDKKMSFGEIKEKVSPIFERIGLGDRDRILNSYPYQLSGGMAQRVSIALSTVLKPRLILADEPTSAVDATVQKQVIGQLKSFTDEFKTSIIIITHNIGVVANMADRVAVLNKGKIVEYGEVKEVLTNPSDSYTKKLLNSIPHLGVKSIGGGQCND